MEAIGVDIGGTKIAAGLVNATGAVGTLLARPTPSNDPDALIAAVVELVEELAHPGAFDTVGVAVAAFLDHRREHVYLSPNIAWSDFPLHARLESALARPVVLENDANAAGWAEFRHGAGQGTQSMVMLTIGTGVGGAIVDRGSLLTGGFGVGGELGHIVVEPLGISCGCGSQGCLEQYASGTALVREAGKLLGRDVSSTELMALFEAGNPLAFQALEGVGDYLGRGIASLVAVLDPEVIVLGGGVAAAGGLLLAPVMASFERNYGPFGKRPSPRIIVAELGNTAGVVGAADLARQGALH
jgi:glucokinase